MEANSELDNIILDGYYYLDIVTSFIYVLINWETLALGDDRSGQTKVSQSHKSESGLRLSALHRFFSAKNVFQFFPVTGYFSRGCFAV